MSRRCCALIVAPPTSSGRTPTATNRHGLCPKITPAAHLLSLYLPSPLSWSVSMSPRTSAFAVWLYGGYAAEREIRISQRWRASSWPRPAAPGCSPLIKVCPYHFTGVMQRRPTRLRSLPSPPLRLAQPSRPISGTALRANVAGTASTITSAAAWRPGPAGHLLSVIMSATPTITMAGWHVSAAGCRRVPGLRIPSASPLRVRCMTLRVTAFDEATDRPAC